MRTPFQTMAMMEGRAMPGLVSKQTTVDAQLTTKKPQGAAAFKAQLAAFR